MPIAVFRHVAFAESYAKRGTLWAFLRNWDIKFYAIVEDSKTLHEKDYFQNSLIRCILQLFKSGFPKCPYGVHHFSYSMGTDGFFLRAKRLGRECVELCVLTKINSNFAYVPRTQTAC